MKAIADMVIDLVQINEDIQERCDGSSIDDFDIYDFDQTWGSTALGFSGMGGQSITVARTYVLIPRDLEVAYVYFGGRFAYRTPINDRFREDIRSHRMASVAESGRYKK